MIAPMMMMTYHIIIKRSHLEERKLLMKKRARMISKSPNIRDNQKGRRK